MAGAQGFDEDEEVVDLKQHATAGLAIEQGLAGGGGVDERGAADRATLVRWLTEDAHAIVVGLREMERFAGATGEMVFPFDDVERVSAVGAVHYRVIGGARRRV